MVLTASFVISPAIGFFVTVIPEKLASHELDASVEASGPHDFSVRIRCSRLWHRQRPPHPAPRFVTIASRPSCRVGTGRACKDDLPDETSALFLAPGLDSFLPICPPGSCGARGTDEKLAPCGERQLLAAKEDVRGKAVSAKCHRQHHEIGSSDGPKRSDLARTGYSLRYVWHAQWHLP